MQSESMSPTKRRAFFGRRKGHKLRPQRAELIEHTLPSLALDLATPPPDRLEKLFPQVATNVALEIGFGGGEHLVHEARSRPETGLIGAEAFVNGMASALSAISSAGLANIRLYFGDAIELLDWLPDQSLMRVDLLYPDPWPKRRHWKRRFVSDERVRQFARILKPGGSFRFASDIESYVEWTLVHFARSKDFEWSAAKADDWRLPWRAFPGTRYETKAKREGRIPVYLTFRRL